VGGFNEALEDGVRLRDLPRLWNVERHEEEGVSRHLEDPRFAFCVISREPDADLLQRLSMSSADPVAAKERLYAFVHVVQRAGEALALDSHRVLLPDERAGKRRYDEILVLRMDLRMLGIPHSEKARGVGTEARPVHSPEKRLGGSGSRATNSAKYPCRNKGRFGDRSPHCSSRLGARGGGSDLLSVAEPVSAVLGSHAP
jgi:hypothetical protein